jgi:hypothetical protein
MALRFQVKREVVSRETFARRHERYENKAKICEKAEFTQSK